MSPAGRRVSGGAVALALAWLCAGAGCGGREDLYQACDVPDDCSAPEEYEPACLEKSGEGFCTWECDADDECADADDGRWQFVCASFESEGGQYCFPGCEDADDEADACPSGMGCRSTGGGSSNRKVCFPEGA